MIRVGLVVYPGAQLLAIAALSAFEFANGSAGSPLYEITLLSEHGGPVPTSAGFAVYTQPFDRRKYDTLLVSGDTSVSKPSPALLAFIRSSARTARRVGATCTGAFNLGAAGLLDGRHVTTHWMYAAKLQREYPTAHVENSRIFIADGGLWTSAGSTAGTDMTLALVEDDFGEAFSRSVAKKLVMDHRRLGGQAQFSTLQAFETESARMLNVIEFATQNLQTDLSVEVLAEVAQLSPRQFTRAFRAETGQSPAKAVEQLRVESARALLESGGQSVDAVAHEAGFGDRERMRRAFLRAFGQPPQVIARSAARR